MGLGVQNNTWSNRAAHSTLAGEPTDLLLLKSKTAACHKVDKQPYLCL